VGAERSSTGRRAADAQRLGIDYAAIAQRLGIDYAAIAQRLGIDYAAIAQRLGSVHREACITIVLSLRPDFKTTRSFLALDNTPFTNVQSKD
jgi:hypothetical protein